MEDNYISAPRKRPPALTVLLLLSTIASVWNIIANSVIFSFTSDISENREAIENSLRSSLESWGLSGLGEDYQDKLALYLDHAPVLSMTELIVAMGTLTGVTFMFRLRKAGFHLYTIMKIIDTALPALLTSVAFFSFLDLFANAVFIFLYSTYLNKMR